MLGESEYIQYLKDNNCKYSHKDYNDVMSWACDRGHLRVVQYVKENHNIPDYGRHIIAATSQEHSSIVEFLLNNVESKIGYHDINIAASIAAGRDNIYLLYQIL